MTLPVDMLRLYFGDDLVLNDKIRVHQPTIGEIVEFGEEQYFTTVSNLTAISSDIKAILWDLGIDWTQLSDLETFYFMTSQMPQELTKIFFGDLKLNEMKLYKRDDGEFAMLNKDRTVIIDRYIHMKISSFLCSMHAIKKKPEFAGNKYTKQVLIDEARQKQNSAKNKEYESQLIPLISGLVNHPGFKYNIEEVRHMPIYAFFDSVARIQLIDSANHLTTAYYSGNLDRDKFDVKKLDWLRDIHKT